MNDLAKGTILGAILVLVTAMVFSSRDSSPRYQYVDRAAIFDSKTGSILFIRGSGKDRYWSEFDFVEGEEIKYGKSLVIPAEVLKNWPRR